MAQPPESSAAPRRRAGSSRTRSGRRSVLAARDFRVFYTGYVTSLLGSAMADIALTFAVLDSGGSAADLGFVFAANVLPLVFFMLAGGVLADRLGRRPVMLAADVSRMAVQAGLAAALFTGRPPVWLFVVLAALLGSAEAFFVPGLGGLTPQLAPAGRLGDANALLGVAQSVTMVAGPALAGVLIATAGPATVIAADAATFGVSVAALARLRVPPAPPAAASPWRDLAAGWAEFRAHDWLWITTLQFTLFNLFTWAPYLLLGPILARQYLGGARAYGVISAALAAGAILTGLALIGRRPRRPMAVAVIGSFGYAAPCLALALHASLAAVTAGAAVAGVASAVFNTYWTTVLQQRVAPDKLSRVNAVSSTGSYALGAAAYAVIGPVADVAGAGRVLGFAAAWATLGSAVVLALPAIRRVRWLDGPPGPAAGADPAAAG
jgi:MFS family permease